MRRREQELPGGKGKAVCVTLLFCDEPGAAAVEIACDNDGRHIGIREQFFTETQIFHCVCRGFLQYDAFFFNPGIKQPGADGGSLRQILTAALAAGADDRDIRMCVQIFCGGINSCL